MTMIFSLQGRLGLHLKIKLVHVTSVQPCATNKKQYSYPTAYSCPHILYMISKIFFFSWQKKILENNYFSQYKFILLQGVQILLWFTVWRSGIDTEYLRFRENENCCFNKYRKPAFLAQLCFLLRPKRPRPLSPIVMPGIV